MKNNISILWEELSYFLENDEDFKIVKVKDNSIEIKTLNKCAFHINYIYCKVLVRIMPLNCTLKLISSSIQADKFENDIMLFKLTINTEKSFYQGTIKITR